MANLIRFPAYIVLDIPSPMAEKVRALRAKFDTPRAALPAEITLTGSCGLGLLSQGQDLDTVLAEAARVASGFPSFYASFDHVERFSSTDIYFLTLKREDPFLALHRALSESAIDFDPNPYPYRPHCTLKLRSKPSETELLELFFLDAPHEEFLISGLSVYALPDPNTCELLAKIPLAAPDSGNNEKKLFV